jgi:site-specific DNA-methyltransferase (adenine-specific)
MQALQRMAVAQTNLLRMRPATVSKVVTIGNATLYLGDCRKILPTIAGIDCIVTDPPYGLGDEKWQGGKKQWRLNNEDGMEWDRHPVDGLVDALAGFPQIVVWGGNYYPFPPARGWLVWDKLVREFSSGHCELAWTTLDQPVRAFNYSHGQLATEGKHHPTQKPAPLMAWCVAMTTGTVCDPFMGSGSTGVACANLGRGFIGIEMNERYFDIACERIAAAQSQGRLFA